MVRRLVINGYKGLLLEVMKVPGMGSGDGKKQKIYNKQSTWNVLKDFYTNLRVCH